MCGTWFWNTCRYSAWWSGNVSDQPQPHSVHTSWVSSDTCSCTRYHHCHKWVHLSLLPHNCQDTSGFHCHNHHNGTTPPLSGNFPPWDSRDWCRFCHHFHRPCLAPCHNDVRSWSNLSYTDTQTSQPKYFWCFKYFCYEMLFMTLSTSSPQFIFRLSQSFL